MNVHRPSCQLLFLSDVTQKWNVTTNCIKNPPMYNLTKMRHLCPEYFHAARQKNTHGISNALFRILFCERAWNIDISDLVKWAV